MDTTLDRLGNGRGTTELVNLEHSVPLAHIPSETSHVPIASPTSDVAKPVTSYSTNGEPRLIGKPPGNEFVKNVSSAPTSKPPNGTTATPTFVSYDAKGMVRLVNGGGNGAGTGAIHGDVADGVYVGFNISGINGKTIPHEFVEVMQNGNKHVFEYGPSNSFLGGEAQPMAEMNSTYGSSAENAGALFAVTPPPNMSLAQFEKQTINLGSAMDQVTKQVKFKYDVTGQLGPNCYTAADSILLNDGVSLNTVTEMGLQASATGIWGNFAQYGVAFNALAAISPAVSVTNAPLTPSEKLIVFDAAAAGPTGVNWTGDASAQELTRDASGQWAPPSTRPEPTTLPSHMQQQFSDGMAMLTGNGSLASVIGSTLTTLLGFTGGAIDLSKPQVSTQAELQITLTQIDQILGALENAIHGGNLTSDLLQIAQALEARDPQGLANVNSAMQLYTDFQNVGKGPQQTIDGILSMGQDILDWGRPNSSTLTGATGKLYHDLQRAKDVVDTGYRVLNDLGTLSQGGTALTIAQNAAQLGVDLHLSGAVAKDYYDVLNGIGALSQIHAGGLLNVTEGVVKLGDTVLSASSAGFGQWLHDNGQNIIGAAQAFEQILGGGAFNIANGSVTLAEDLVKLNVVDAKSALGTWLTNNAAKFTGIVGGIASIVSGFEEGGFQGGIQAGVGADVLITSIGLSGGLATPVAIVIGILTVAFGGNHDKPANMPDKYDTQRYGQMVADMQGAMGANGQSFTETSELRSLFGGRTGIQAVEETLAYYQTKANAPSWLQPLWDQLVARFGENAQGNGHLAIGINGSGKECNNEQITGVAGTDGKMHQYVSMGSLMYAFAAALAQATSGHGLAADSGYTGAYPSINGLDWHAVQTGSGFGFYAEDTANLGHFYSYDPSNNNLYSNTNAGVIGGTWVGDVRTYDFKAQSAIVGQAPPTPTYGGVAWHGFSLPQGGIAYWGAVTTKVTVPNPNFGPPDDSGLPGPGRRVIGPIGPRTITEMVTSYYYFGSDGILYTGIGPGSLAKQVRVGNVQTYNFEHGGSQSPTPVVPILPLPILPIKHPPSPVAGPVVVRPLPLPILPIKHLPSPVAAPVVVPPRPPVTLPKSVRPIGGRLPMPIMRRFSALA